MKIDELWPELEAARMAAAKHRGGSGWVLRQLRPDPSCPLNASIELSTGRRALLLVTASEDMPPKRRWPACRGLEVIAVKEGDSLLFGVALKEARHSDIFSALAEDLARRVAAAADSVGRVSAMLGGLARWQKFLSVRTDGLSAEAQRGLWAELHFLRGELIALLGARAAVTAWQGPSGYPQDFVVDRVAVEVKATAAKPPFVVTISSERQLDAQNLQSLFLRHYALSEGENGGQSLAAAVMVTRAALADTEASELFEDRLLAASYLDIHAARYEARGWRIRETRDFAVKEGFPKLVESCLPAGVGSVRYNVALAACEQFAIDAASLRATLSTLADSK